MQAPPLYVVRSFGLREIVENDYVLNISPAEEKKYYIKQSDCQYFRLIRLITGVTSKFNPYVIFVDINYHTDLPTVISKLVMDGITVRGIKFVMGERSASMTRQGTLSFVDAKVSRLLEDKITMGLDIGETVLSKWQAYRGLAMSSCHCIEGYLPKMIVVPDYETVIPAQNIKYLRDEKTKYVNKDGEAFEWTQKAVAEDVRDIKINAFDGVGIMHADVAAKIESIIQSTTPITTCIFRAPFIKGCLHVMDYEAFLTERGVEEITDIWGVKHSVHDKMVILTESMYKGYKYFKHYKDSRDWDAYWEAFKKYDHCFGIAKANFTEEEENIYTRCNYQVLQTLDLDYDAFKTLADDTVRWIGKIVSGDKLYAKCFLGIVDGKCKAMNPYVAAIAKNDAMMQERNTRSYITSLLNKALDEMKCGKLYIRSCFKFLAPDLVALMEHIGGLPIHGCLGATEFWTKGPGVSYRGEYLITRNPHICKSENVVLSASVDEQCKRWVGHLSNVCMVNIRSITPQRLNGADFDGDLVLVIDNQTMLSGVDRNAKIVIDADDKITAKAEADIPQNRIAAILRTTKSFIGEFSNYASVYLNRRPKTDAQADKYQKFTEVISVITGKSIDYAKTGVLYPMPRNISKFGRPLPYFMRYRSPYYARQKLAKSPSNMNRLCWDMERWERNIRWKRAEPFDWHTMYDESVTYTEDEYNAILEIFNWFCAESDRLRRYQIDVRKGADSDMSAKLTSTEVKNYVADWGGFYAETEERAKATGIDEQKIANIAVFLSCAKFETKGKKFPFIVAPEGLVKNIRPGEGTKMPYRDPEGDCVYLGKRYSLVDASIEEVG